MHDIFSKIFLDICLCNHTYFKANQAQNLLPGVSLVPDVRNPILTFDPDLTLTLTSKLILNACFKFISMRPFERRSISLDQALDWGAKEMGRI